LTGNYVDNIFDLAERKRALDRGRNKHMQKQAVTRTANMERLKEFYASAKRMTAGTIFGTGNGLLQEEVRDEVRAREQRKLSNQNSTQMRERRRNCFGSCAWR
jgi:hypothetical protein